MRGRRFAIAVLFLAGALLALGISVSAKAGPTMTLRASTTTPQVGDTVNVDIRVENVTNLYAADIQLKFDAALLQVLDDDLSKSGIQILPGSLFPQTEPNFVVVNLADNAAGTIRFAITLLAPADPVSGSGTLATIRFAARTAGTAQVTWQASTLVDNLGSAIIPTTSPLQLVISSSTPTPTPTPTNTPTTPYPTPIPTVKPGNCTDLIENGEFEETRKWDMPITPHKANYSTADKHGGARSVRLGIEPGDWDVYSHSSAYQKIHVPANADSVILTFWARRFTQETPKAAVDPSADLYDPAEVIEGRFDWSTKSSGAQYDWQEVLILQGDCYNWLATLMRERSNDGVWTKYTYDITTFAGQDIVVYFNVINNGWGGRRTWMYVDDVEVESCYGTSTCAEQVSNRSFEWTSDWTRANTPRPANYTTDYAHIGTRSMRMGVTSSTWDTYSHSSAYQRITVPSGAVNPTLSFWYKAHTEDVIRSDWKDRNALDYEPGKVIAGEKVDAKCCGEVDWQEMLLLDTNYRLLSGGVVMRQVRNDGVWRQMTYDLSPYKGMTVVLYFNVINDGNGRRTWMYVDDVSVNLCGQQVRFEPAYNEADAGQEFVTNVYVENIGDLYAIDTTVRFDPNIVEVVQVSPGSWWSSMNPYIVVNTIDNASGEVRFAATLKNPDPPLNGSGSLVTIRFRGKTPGSTPLWLSALKLVDSGAVVIPTSHADGQAVITGTPPPPALVGDINGDGCVDIQDLAVVGSQFGSTSPNPPEADINGDGVVDIVDVVLVANNFNVCQ